MKPIAHLITDGMENAFQESELRSAVGRLQNLPFTDELDDVLTEGANKYSVLEVEDVETAVSSPGYE